MKNIFKKKIFLNNKKQRTSTTLNYLTGSTWSNSDSKALNTPSLGSNLVSNGDMETGDPPTGYTAVNAVLSRIGTAYEGSDALSVTSSTGTNTRARYTINTVAGQWYYAEVYARRGSAGTDQAFRMESAITTDVYIASSTYAKYLVTDLSTLSSHRLQMFATRDSGSVSDNGYFDNLSANPLTFTELFAYVQGDDYSDVECYVNTLQEGSQVGGIGWLDSPSTPQNFILWFVNGESRVMVLKCVGGTYTSLLNMSLTFVEDAEIYIKRTDTDTFQLWYNGSQVGTDLTISDTGITDTTEPYFGLFSTNQNSLFSSLPFTIDSENYYING